MDQYTNEPGLASCFACPTGAVAPDHINCSGCALDCGRGSCYFDQSSSPACSCPPLFEGPHCQDFKALEGLCITLGLLTIAATTLLIVWLRHRQLHGDVALHARLLNQTTLQLTRMREAFALDGNEFDLLERVGSGAFCEVGVSVLFWMFCVKQYGDQHLDRANSCFIDPMH